MLLNERERAQCALKYYTAPADNVALNRISVPVNKCKVKLTCADQPISNDQCG